MPDAPPTSPEYHDEEPLTSPKVESPLPPLNGLYAQYFAVGLVYGVLPGTLYGFYLGYLGVESHVYSTAAQVISLPWSFKFMYGMLNDRVPIAGCHRKPYMAMGWAICATALAVIANTAMPAPGDAYAAGPFAARMAVAAVGYVMADVAADGLVVQYAKQESLPRRGTLQSTVYLVRTLGSIVAALVVGLGMNGREYNGTFDVTLSFTHVCGMIAVPAAAMVPISWIYIEEPTPEPPIPNYLHECWSVLEGKAMFYVVVYTLGHSVVGGIYTTAGPHVTRIWAGVDNLQAKLFGVLGMAVFAAGLALVRKHFLNTSWRKIIAVTTLGLGAVDAAFVYCTVFDVVRNQYFYLGEDVITMVPAAARFLVTTFVVVEMAPDGLEGITYGMLTTLHNLGGPIARALSNQIFGLGFTGLTQASNYVQDTPAFRMEVAWSYGVGYAAGLIALAFLCFMPDQKQQAQYRLQTWGKSKRFAQITVVTTVVCWIYAITINLLAMFPSTSCLNWVGGGGCHVSAQAAHSDGDAE